MQQKRVENPSPTVIWSNASQRFKLRLDAGGSLYDEDMKFFNKPVSQSMHS